MTAFAPSLWFFDPATRPEKKPAPTDRPETETQRERRLFCAACRHPVTHQDERIVIAGGHEHRCTNPHGLKFHIGCFRAAEGCAPIGTATSEFTWFLGFAWRIVLCRHCRAHLGWRFQSEGEYFHGLIVDRLISAGPVHH